MSKLASYRSQLSATFLVKLSAQLLSFASTLTSSVWLAVPKWTWLALFEVELSCLPKELTTLSGNPTFFYWLITRSVNGYVRFAGGLTICGWNRVVGIFSTSSWERLAFDAASLFVEPNEKAGGFFLVDCFCRPSEEPRSTVSEHGFMPSIIFIGMAVNLNG